MTHRDIVAIGDLHLQHTNPRNVARLRALDDIITAATSPDRRDTLGAWVLLGDLFHARSSAQDRNDLATRLMRMGACAPVVIIAGNHDLPGELNIFADLRSACDIEVVTTPRLVRVYLAIGGEAAIACLPYPHKGALVAGSPSAAVTALTGEAALLDVCRGLGLQLQEAVDEGAYPLFAGHANIVGSLTSNGQPAIGQELALDAAMLDAIGDVPKLLGHIHKPQDLHGATYVGSVCRLDWGECEEKRVVIVEYSSDEDAFADPRLVSIPVAVTPMYHVEGTLTRDDFTWQVTAGPGGGPQAAPDSWAGCEVRVRYRFPASERDVLPVGRVRDTFAGADRVDLEPVAVPDAQVRAPQVAAARTLADKLGAWADLNGQPLRLSVREKLAQLEHADAALVLTAVSSLVADVVDARREGRAA